MPRIREPGTSTIDVVLVYGDATRRAYKSYPFTRIHHVMALANAIFRDSGTNIRLRTVGMIEVEFNELGLLDDVHEVMEPLGADLLLRFYAPVAYGPCGVGLSGCAGVGSSANRGLWRFAFASVRDRISASFASHELGHVMGLAPCAHSVAA